MGETREWKEEVNEGLDHGVLSARGEMAHEVREGMRLDRQDGRGVTDPSGGHWGLTLEQSNI